jgi:hypothetical protein
MECGRVLLAAYIERANKIRDSAPCINEPVTKYKSVKEEERTFTRGSVRDANVREDIVGRPPQRQSQCYLQTVHAHPECYCIRTQKEPLDIPAYGLNDIVSK